MVVINATSDKLLKEERKKGGILPSDKEMDQVITETRNFAEMLDIESKKISNDEIKEIITSMSERVMEGTGKITMEIPGFDLDSCDPETRAVVEKLLKVMAAQCLSYVSLTIAEYQITGNLDRFAILTTAMSDAVARSALSAQDIMAIALAKH